MLMGNRLVASFFKQRNLCCLGRVRGEDIQINPPMADILSFGGANDQSGETLIYVGYMGVFSIFLAIF